MNSPLALVTGAAKRIGKHLAITLAKHGYDLVIHFNSSESEAGEVVEEIKRLGQKAIKVQANLDDPQQAAATVFAEAKQMGPVSLLINNASVFQTGTLENTEVEDFRKHQRINLEAPLFLSQEFARQLPEAMSGQIINLLDWRAERPPLGHLSYTISKAGLLSLTQMLAQELTPQIRVNGIALGAILPPPDAGKEYDQRVAQMVPLKKHGSPDDVAKAMMFLLDSDFANGNLVHVTGGEHLGKRDVV